MRQILLNHWLRSKLYRFMVFCSPKYDIYREGATLPKAVMTHPGPNVAKHLTVVIYEWPG
jgi:hypothetical protein